MENIDEILLRDIIDKLYAIDWAAKTVVISCLLDLQYIDCSTERREWLCSIRDSIYDVDSEALLDEAEPPSNLEFSRINKVLRFYNLEEFNPHPEEENNK